MRSFRFGVALAACALYSASAPRPVAAQAPVATADGSWPVYGGDAHHTRYTPLNQIDGGNVGRLQVVWRRSTEDFGPVPESRNASTPLMVGGRLFVTAGAHRAVAALDPGTGVELWRWEPSEEDRLDRAPRVNSGRGVAYWSDGAGDDRIIVVTPGYRMVALNAADGTPVVTFGEDGVVDLMAHHRTRPGVPMVGSIGASSPAAVVGDVVVVGSAQHVGMRPPSMVNTPGDVRGYDARTGRLLWTFKTVPEAGEEGYETWLEGSAEYSGNAGVWAAISHDPATQVVYLPTEAATGDLYGGHRPGANLFSSSVVALDARTGRRLWHFQTVRHDVWDWDNPTAPILADLVVDGVPRRIVAQVTKQGFVYVLDRRTGLPVWPMEERQVPASDVPGEWSSPTQPVPTRPAPFEKQGFGEDDLLDLTPEIHARALELARTYRWGELFSPPSLVDAPDGTRGTLMMPSTIGGANWEGAALDPETGYLYIPTVTAPSVYALEPAGDASDMSFIAVSGRTQVAPGVPMVKPPWGRIVAIDLTRGDQVWAVVNGDTPAHVPRRLGLDPERIPATGKPIRGGLLVTGTLLFAAEGFGGDPVLRALDKATGRTVASLDLPAAGTGHPISYMHDGRQYVVLAVGSTQRTPEFVAFALP